MEKSRACCAEGLSGFRKERIEKRLEVEEYSEDADRVRRLDRIAKRDDNKLRNFRACCPSCVASCGDVGGASLQDNFCAMEIRCVHRARHHVAA